MEKIENLLKIIFPDIPTEWWWENRMIDEQKNYVHVRIDDFDGTFLEELYHITNECDIKASCVAICTNDGHLTLEIWKSGL